MTPLLETGDAVLFPLLKLGSQSDFHHAGLPSWRHRFERLRIACRPGISRGSTSECRNRTASPVAGCEIGLRPRFQGLLVAAGLLVAPAAHAHVGPHPAAGIAFDQHLGAVVKTDLGFVDARGGRETLGDAIGGKPTVLLLGYLGCKDLCSLALPGAAKALDRAGLKPGRDYRAIFASIDPREKAQALAAGYDRLAPADRGAWSFLGGNEASSAALAASVGFHYRYEADHDAFAHPAGLVLLSPDGRISRYLFGVSYDPAELRLALAEAGQGRTGSLSDRLLLLCYHFDPSTGRYTARILDGLRILIGLCAAAAAVFAWRVVRHREPGAGA